MLLKSNGSQRSNIFTLVHIITDDSVKRSAAGGFGKIFDVRSFQERFYGSQRKEYQVFRT
eukprot:UN18786